MLNTTSQGNANQTTGSAPQPCSCSVVSDSWWPHGLESSRLLCPWNFPGRNTGVGCHSLFQGTFPTRGSNPGLLHCRQILHQLSHVYIILTPVRMLIIKKANKSVLVTMWREPSCTGGKNVNWHGHYRKQHGGSFKKLELPYGLAILFQGIYSEKTKTLIWKDSCTPIHCCIINNSADMEAT